ncbi:hypothetical protein PMAYCL1PPCAC_24743, partial [Pristionchus mayeri]
QLSHDAAAAERNEHGDQERATVWHLSSTADQESKAREPRDTSVGKNDGSLQSFSCHCEMEGCIEEI